jgi:CRP/FNR family cyclic AMP-dependent transcriptional regulator
MLAENLKEHCMKVTGLKSFPVLENVIFLKKTALFSNVKTSELKAVASIVEELSFTAGDEVVKESDSGDSAYIIKEGRIKITKKASDSGVIDLAELSSGECFGEMSLFDEESRCATAYALTPCVVLRLLRDDLIDVIEEHPYIAVELIKIFVKRLRAANVKIESKGSSIAERR